MTYPDPLLVCGTCGGGKITAFGLPCGDCDGTGRAACRDCSDDATEVVEVPTGPEYPPLRHVYRKERRPLCADCARLVREGQDADAAGGHARHSNEPDPSRRTSDLQREERR